MPIATTPFEVAEIRDIILSHVDRKSLESAARVSKAWFGFIYPRLWSRVNLDAIERLMRLEFDRLQLYQDCVDFLCVEISYHTRQKWLSRNNLSFDKTVEEEIYDAHIQQALNFVEFKNLRKIDLYTYGDWELAHLLVPTLRSIVSSNAMSLAQLPNGCPNLEQLKVIIGQNTQAWDDLSNSLERCASLTDLSITCPEWEEDTLIFRDILRQGQLRRLCLTSNPENVARFREAAVKANSWDGVPPCLRHLHAIMTLPSLVAFTGTGTSLRTLCLQFFGNTHPAFRIVGGMQSLISLTMCCDGTHELTFDDYQNLQPLSSLEHLALRADGDNFRDSEAYCRITDGDFATFIQCFPRLRSFCHYIHSDLTALSLVQVGRSCPRVRNVLFKDLFDLELLVNEQSDCLFPALEVLCLGSAAGNADCYRKHSRYKCAPHPDPGAEFRNPSPTAAALRKHAPRLSIALIGHDEKSISIKAGALGKDNRYWLDDVDSTLSYETPWSRTVKNWASKMFTEIWKFSDKFNDESKMDIKYNRGWSGFP